MIWYVIWMFDSGESIHWGYLNRRDGEIVREMHGGCESSYTTVPSIILASSKGVTNIREEPQKPVLYDSLRIPFGGERPGLLALV